MTEDARKQSSALGMNQEISRRDFMNATLLASGGALLGGLTPHQLLAQMGKDNWTGYGGVGDYAESNGNTFEVMTAGHQIRDHVFADPPHEVEETGEVLDCVIAGGGLSGLATALYFQQHAPRAKCLVLENHPIFGGEAKRNEFMVDGHRLIAPQGSDHFDTPHPGSPSPPSMSPSASMPANSSISRGKAPRRRYPWAGASSTFDPPMASISAPTSANSPVRG